MTKHRTSLALEAIWTTWRRKDSATLQKEFTDDSWMVTRKANMLEFFANPIHDLPRYATKYELFTALFPPDFLHDVLVERGHKRDGGLSFNKGNKNVWTVEDSEDLAMRIITVRLQVHTSMDRQCLYKAGIKKACDVLRTYDSKMEGSGIMQRIVSVFYLELDSMDEEFINDYLEGIFSSLDDRLAGDKKLFKFVVKSGYV